MKKRPFLKYIIIMIKHTNYNMGGKMKKRKLSFEIRDEKNL